jgi:hypothetical protein
VPAYVLPVDVRRGSHTFPFALTWLAAVDEYAAVRCPACDASQRLVAGRDRLGCESCIPRAAAGYGTSSAPAVSPPAERRTDISPVAGPLSANPGSGRAEGRRPQGRQGGGAKRPVNRGAPGPVSGGAKRSVNRRRCAQSGSRPTSRPTR